MNLGWSTCSILVCKRGGEEREKRRVCEIELYRWQKFLTRSDEQVYILSINVISWLIQLMSDVITSEEEEYRKECRGIAGHFERGYSMPGAMRDLKWSRKKKRSHTKNEQVLPVWPDDPRLLIRDLIGTSTSHAFLNIFCCLKISKLHRLHLQQLLWPPSGVPACSPVCM